MPGVEMSGAAQSIPELMGFPPKSVDIGSVRSSIAVGMREGLSNSQGSPALNALAALESYAHVLAQDAELSGHSTAAQSRFATYLGHLLDLANGGPVQFNIGESNGE